MSLDAIEALLDREYLLLTSGRLAALAQLAEYKDALLARLKDTDRVSATDLERLRLKATRNDALLEAAARGARAALHQIAEARAYSGQVTYLADGRTRRLGDRAAKLERKV